MRLMRAFGIVDENRVAEARRHLLRVGERVLESAIVRSNDDYRHLLIDKRYGPVLELTGRIAFGMDVRDLLELEGPFKRKREACPATEIKDVVGFREIDRERLDLRLKRERLGRQARHVDERTHQRAFILRREHTARPTRRDREACHDG